MEKDRRGYQKPKRGCDWLNKQIVKLSVVLEKHMQHSRCNCLLLHGISEEKFENADKTFLGTMSNEEH